jgi:hypothetical protein
MPGRCVTASLLNGIRRSWKPRKAVLPSKTLANSQNSRTVALLESRGYKCDICESYNAFTKRKKDLFHIFDILAIGNGETIGIQITSKSNMSSRIKKISESEYLPELLRSKWRLIVIGWYKQPNGRYNYKEFEF